MTAAAPTQYRAVGAEAFADQVIIRLNEKIERTDFLVRTLESERRLFRHGIIADEEINFLGNRAFAGERTTFWKIRRTMRWLGATICVPLMGQNELTGFIVLGNKKNQTLYNNEDKRFLSHVAEIISTAIKNSLNEPRPNSSASLQSGNGEALGGAN